MNGLLGRSSAPPTSAQRTELEDDHYKHGFSNAAPFFSIKQTNVKVIKMLKSVQGVLKQNIKQVGRLRLNGSFRE